jgi:O-antigen/teichoic acid export membrane protein
VQRTFDVALAAGAVLAVALATAAPIAVELVGGARYEGASTVLRWHSLALLGAFAAAPIGYAFLAAGHVRDVLKMTVGALVVAVALTVPLAASAGATGAAAAGAAAEWALATTGLVLMRRRVGRRLSLAAVPKVLVPSLVIALAAQLLRPEVGAPIATVALVAVLLGLRVAPVEIREILRLPQRLASGRR